eukprot:NODE_237_length_11991_cov_1.642899.p8 type:complete len:189 gc:universal NODE_237_length_11991_cov_1.642899:10635-11201(+)
MTSSGKASIHSDERYMQNHSPYRDTQESSLQLNQSSYGVSGYKSQFSNQYMTEYGTEMDDATVTDTQYSKPKESARSTQYTAGSRASSGYNDTYFDETARHTEFSEASGYSDTMYTAGTEVKTMYTEATEYSEFRDSDYSELRESEYTGMSESMYTDAQKDTMYTLEVRNSEFTEYSEMTDDYTMYSE